MNDSTLTVFLFTCTHFTSFVNGYFGSGTTSATCTHSGAFKGPRGNIRDRGGTRKGGGRGQGSVGDYEQESGI